MGRINELFRRLLPLRKADAQPPLKRAFSGAQFSRLTDWVLAGVKINQELRTDYVTLSLRARDLAQNNEFVAAWLSSVVRNVIGPSGFTLQSRSADPALRRTIEVLWREYQSRSAAAVTLDESQSGRDFDTLVLRTLCIYGEAFIRRVYDPASRFGVRYELIDPLAVDPYYWQEPLPGLDGDRIVMGIRLDARGRAKAYYVRQSTQEDYFSGPRVEVPAAEMIHIYRRNLPDQVRGYSPLAPVILNLHQLDGYKESEVIHARIAACSMGVWEQNGDTGVDLIDQQNDKGEFVREFKPGIWPVAPRGYTAKFLQNAGPNGQFGPFWKAMIRSVAGALGVSYNKAAGDYESTSYSSLREASLEDRATYAELQNFFVESWKSLQFRAFLDDAAASGLIPRLSASDYAHRFFGRQQSWVDPKAEIEAKGDEYRLLLTDPITELESRGIDPEETLDHWREFRRMCAARGIDPDTMLGVFVQKTAGNNNNQPQSEAETKKES